VRLASSQAPAAPPRADPVPQACSSHSADRLPARPYGSAVGRSRAATRATAVRPTVRAASAAEAAVCTSRVTASSSASTRPGGPAATWTGGTARTRGSATGRAPARRAQAGSSGGGNPASAAASGTAAGPGSAAASCRCRSSTAAACSRPADRARSSTARASRRRCAAAASSPAHPVDADACAPARRRRRPSTTGPLHLRSSAVRATAAHRPRRSDDHTPNAVAAARREDGSGSTAAPGDGGPWSARPVQETAPRGRPGRTGMHLCTQGSACGRRPAGVAPGCCGDRRPERAEVHARRRHVEGPVR
jgi:hypothetical protein